ncbi:Homocysteine S-methyltransferase [Artemisia annua]|uniref:Homocysteine S-methyltransferase n=1 Tax=Artemisia annua TaxID=35608 RepID=A0A2U1N6Z0_ARTAN|nr:Homocysteine S-methyltransferase [Artemisia annua]
MNSISCFAYFDSQVFVELLEEGVNIPAWFPFNSKDGVNVVSGDSLAECAKIAESTACADGRLSPRELTTGQSREQQLKDHLILLIVVLSRIRIC